MAVNVKGPFFCTKYAIPQMREAGGGSIINLSSILTTLYPIGFLGDPMDIAYGVLFLASDESRFMTGSEMVMDGGYTAR